MNVICKNVETLIQTVKKLGKLMLWATGPWLSETNTSTEHILSLVHSVSDPRYDYIEVEYVSPEK